LTIKAERGRNVGRFNAIVGFSSGIGLFFGGYMVKFYGLKALFYLASIIVALSTMLLFFIKEDGRVSEDG
jgi:MFS family permease